MTTYGCWNGWADLGDVAFIAYTYGWRGGTGCGDVWVVCGWCVGSVSRT